MIRCNWCWWIIWRDCFNQLECVQISRNNEDYYNNQRYSEEFEHFDIRNFSISELIKEIFKRIKWKIIILKNKRKLKKECDEEISIEDIPF